MRKEQGRFRCKADRDIYIYSRTVGRSSASFDSLVFVLASNPAAASAASAASAADLFSEPLDFSDRAFKDQFSSLAETS